MSSDKDGIGSQVGQALRALLRAGASDEVLGEFARTFREELSRPQRSQPAEVLTEAPGGDQLLARLDDLARKVDVLGLQLAGMSGSGKRSPAQMVGVRVDGKRTNVTVPDAVFKQTVAAKGSAQEARLMIQELANAAPAGVANRSGWVQERLVAALAFPDQAADSPRH